MTTTVDPLTLPLDGAAMIEASAGTGKTWTITSLYLRLLLEHRLAVDQILVVTYTKAATEELRERLRQRIVAVKAYLSGRRRDADPFVTALCQRIGDVSEAVEILDLAVRSFDQAAVFTIHGLCQRVLADQAVESRQPFALELVSDNAEAVKEVIDDYWRAVIARESPLVVDYLFFHGLSPDKLYTLTRNYLDRPYLQFRLPEDNEALSPLESALQGHYQRLRSLWQGSKEQIAALLADSTSLNRRQYPAEKIPVWIETMDRFMTPQSLAAVYPPEELKKLTSGSLSKAAKKGKEAPEHPFFQECQDFWCLLDRYRDACGVHARHLVARAVPFISERLEQCKKTRRQQFFDDLLTRLRDALCGAEGDALAQILRRRFRAALIDEFQDTDPVQYEIFNRIYQHSGQPVFFVGDPKQAIYRFRGADVFTYLGARRRQSACFSLTINWRSTPAMVAAINRMFSLNTAPFLIAQIDYPSVRAARDGSGLKGTAGGDGLYFVELFPDEGGKARLTKTEAQNRIAQTTAMQIQALLAQGREAELLLEDGADGQGGRPVDGRDIAVLVRSHHQGQLMRDALQRLGIAAVQYAQDNVFETAEAAELELVLKAIVEPQRPELLRAALATRVLGYDVADILAAENNPALWEQWVDHFLRYHEMWQTHGFIYMSRRLLVAERIAPRLLEQDDGERRLTDLMHLMELLQERSRRRSCGMEALLNWLVDRRQSPGGEHEEHRLRLESDRYLVKIITVHKSKGLEYPIVFCPFMWYVADRDKPRPPPRDGARLFSASAALEYHDPEAGYQAVVDFAAGGGTPQAQWAFRERLAEDLRLLYVALTRAKYRCYLAWGAMADSEFSALAWVLHADEVGTPVDDLAVFHDHVATLAPAQIRNRLMRIAAASGGAISLAPQTGERPREVSQGGQLHDQPLQFRRFRGAVAPAWRVTSFTGLAGGIGRPGTGRFDEQGEDQYPAGESVEELSVHSFPRGARTGACWHEILEHCDFSASRSALAVVVERVLRRYGFEDIWQETVTEMVYRTLTVSLNPSEGLQLCRVGAADRQVESGFYFSLQRFSVGEVFRLAAEYGYELAAGDGGTLFGPGGYMQGYIDLIFRYGGKYYIVDYKSNWLGTDGSAYMPERLAAAMIEHHYPLQYLIYCIAVHRMLSRRLPGYDYRQHFGGVYYLFLRGIAAEGVPMQGVFFDRPEAGLITALDRYCLDAREDGR